MNGGIIYASNYIAQHGTTTSKILALITLGGLLVTLIIIGIKMYYGK